MASTDYNGEKLEGTVYSSLPLEGAHDPRLGSLGSNLFGTTVAIYYKMRGMDQATAGLYDTWVIFGVPDFTATYYAGVLNLPLRDVVIDSSWTS